MEPINNLLENPKPYKWAVEAACGSVFGAGYRYSKHLAEREDEIPHEKKLTSTGMGLLAETGDYLRDLSGKETLFGPEDWVLITGSAYTGQEFVDRYLED